MSNFWPRGIEIKNRQSPMQILETAQKDWAKNSEGELTLLLQETQSESGNSMIIVHAKHVPTDRISTLFSVIYRPNSHYPATIEPKKDDLPNFLRKSYYKPGIAVQPVAAALIGKGTFGQIVSEGQQVKNTWVSDEPSEFREKLEQVFNLSIIKSDILNLLSGFQEATTNDEEEQLDSEYVVEN